MPTHGHQPGGPTPGCPAATGEREAPGRRRRRIDQQIYRGFEVLKRENIAGFRMRGRGGTGADTERDTRKWLQGVGRNGRPGCRGTDGVDSLTPASTYIPVLTLEIIMPSGIATDCLHMYGV